MLSDAFESSSVSKFEEDLQMHVSHYSKSENISARRHLIRAVRETMLSMEQREALQRKEWDVEIQKLTKLKIV